MLVCLVMLFGICSSAWAACPKQEAWAKRCEADGFSFTIQSCPQGVIVGSARLNSGAELPIELKQATESSFRRVGDTGVQPIGEFDDWNRETESRRRTLDAMLACVRRVGAPPLPSLAEEADATEPGGSPRLLLLGLLLLGVALGLRLSLLRKASRKSHVRDAVLLAGFTLLVAWLRWRIVPPATFHQNGQGPLWISLALNQSSGGSIYGPGYAEIGGWLASRMDPETAIFLLHSVLYALLMPAVFALARMAGLGRGVSWLLVCGLALQPLAARLAGGESYFATISGLGMLACLAMVTAAQPEHDLRAPRRRWLFLTGALAAGVLVAQAARVHPVGWGPLALTPVAPLCLSGSLRTRIIRTAIIGGCVAVLVLGTSAVEMLKVLAGELGRQWLPQARFSWDHALPALKLFPLLWLVAGLRPRALLPALGFCLVLGVALGNHPLRNASNLIADAVYWLYLPALLGAFVGWLTRLHSLARVVSCACAVGLACGYGWSYRHTYLTLPTDAREIRAANRWKHELPLGANVAYVNRVDQRVFFLPLYDSSRIGSVRLTPEHPTVPSVPNLFYYRSSLCSVPEGKQACDRVESQLVLSPVHEAAFPAIPSLPYLPLGNGPIRVTLFKARLKSDASR